VDEDGKVLRTLPEGLAWRTELTAVQVMVWAVHLSALLSVLIVARVQPVRDRVGVGTLVYLLCLALFG
jgi:hypothetical protein